ncbi:hypothetical protein MNV49_001952 [Pseudohyphozyma bogoriensis]|nr:hypothetical protein MNV49_001952 [Pseudohyphozyma bogoriensis]
MARRSNRPEDSFPDRRRMCNKHGKPAKLIAKSTSTTTDTASIDPSSSTTLLDPPTLLHSLREAVDSSSLHRFEASVSLKALPGQEEVEAESRSYAAMREIGNGREEREEKDVKPMSEQQVETKKARILCKKLVEMIQEGTGYYFIYKDCRSGRKLKYAHSLRYVCSQRLDLDQTKRRTAAAASDRKRATAPEDDDSSKATADFNAATIAAIVAASKQNAEDEDGDIPTGSGGLDLSNLAGLVIPQAHGEDEDGEEEGGEEDEEETKAAVKKRPATRKMERFDCRGGLTININNDGDTVFFTLTHALQHPAYVDVVGNRERRTVGPPVINLQSAVQAPVGSVDVAGHDIFDKVERTFVAMLETVKLLRATHERAEKLGVEGGNEWAAKELFEKSEEVRRVRVSIVEAFARSGVGVTTRNGRGRGTKRGRSEEEDGGVGLVEREDGAVVSYEDLHTAPRPQPGNIMIDADSSSIALSLGLNPDDVVNAGAGGEDTDMSSVIARLMDNQINPQTSWVLDPSLGGE